MGVNRAYGGVVISGGDRVLLREPTKHYGGYTWTFPKTAVAPGLKPEDAALQAVRKKTGYEGIVRAVIPGEFKSSDSVSCYFLLEAKHPPVAHNWQTAGLRWASYDEAKELIQQSSNKEGRTRDLAVLDAAMATLRTIPYRKHLAVQPEDWTDLQPMPERHIVLNSPGIWFSANDMMEIRRGFYPTVMEQKWFLYFTGNRLRMHRGWTGILVFDVGFAFDSQECACVSDIIVNRDREQYQGKDNNEDLVLMQKVIRSFLITPFNAPEQDGLVTALQQGLKSNYLGSPQVVYDLIGSAIQAMVNTFSEDEESDPDALNRAMLTAVNALVGSDEKYQIMPNWHCMTGLGDVVQKYLILPQYKNDKPDNFKRVVTNGIGSLMLKTAELMDCHLKDPHATWDEHGDKQLKALHQFGVSVLLGTNTLTYGEMTLQDFEWKQASVA